VSDVFETLAASMKTALAEKDVFAANGLSVQYRRELAGECVRCVNWDDHAVEFSLECIDCKRYCADKFEEATK